MPQSSKREVARLRRERTGNEDRLRAELGGITRSIQRCLDFITGGDVDPGSVREQLRTLEERKRDLERRLNGRPTPMNVDVHPNLPDLYRKKIENLQALLADETARPQAVEIIRSLVERIDVHPGAERGRCEVIIVGALAHILAFTQQQTTAVPGGDDGTFLLVAGARSQFYLLFAAKGLIAGQVLERQRKSRMAAAVHPYRQDSPAGGSSTV